MNARSVLLGAGPVVRRRHLRYALGLGLVLLGILGVFPLLNAVGRSPGVSALGLVLASTAGFFFLALCLAVYAGYRRAGVLVCLASPTTVVFMLNLVLLANGGNGLHWMAWFWGVPVGLAGFVVGGGLHRLIHGSGD